MKKKFGYHQTNANSMRIGFATRKRNLAIGLFAIVLAIFSFTFASVDTDKIDLGGVAYASLAIAPLAWIGKDNSFKKLSADEVAKLTDEEVQAYSKALNEATEKREAEIAKRLSELDKDNEAHKEELAALKLELGGIDKETIKEMMSALKTQGEYLKQLKEQGLMSKKTFKTELKAAFDAKLDILNKARKTKTGDIGFEVAKIANYGDIDSGLDFAQMRVGVTDIPVRRTRIRDLFRSLPVSTEFFKYTEQLTCVRDAQNVASQTAPTTKNTKETLKVNSIQTRIVKAIIPFCRDFVADYPFMMSRIELLLNTAIALEVEDQLLNGTGTGEELFSINSVSSEFDPANPVADVAGSIQVANLVDLIKAMALQVDMLGKLGAYNADKVLVNKVDWFLGVESKKDANNNYLDSRVTNVNGKIYVGNLEVVWLTSDLLAQNKIYVFDSTKGEIVDRMMLNIDISFENGTNWELEIAEMKGYERINFLVENNNKNAFMKCSDVAGAIEDITKV